MVYFLILSMLFSWVFTGLYIEYNTKFFYLSTRQFKFHLNLVYVFHKTLSGKYVLQALRWSASLSLFILHYISLYFFEAERYKMCWVCYRDTQCVLLCLTIMFDCSHICIIIYPVEYTTVVLYFLLFKNVWGKDFSVYNFIFILISILFKAMFHHEIT